MMADDMISDTELDEIFRTTIDAFIDQANLLTETNSKENVGLALLYAAARFNAYVVCLLYTSPSPRDGLLSRMPSSA